MSFNLKISFPKKGVTRIESNNFKNYPSIDELILDENLISIDSFAFRTSSIKRVNLSKCENLDSKKLNERAFSNSSIEEIVLPQQVNILPLGAFLNCKHLRTITGSNLLATYTDNYKTHAVQFDRAVHSCKFCFENCNNLQFIQFSPKLSIDGIKRLLCHSGYNEDKTCYEKENFYNDKRCGIVLEIDDYYSYIWCFTDFTFYLSKKIDKSFLNKIVSFYNSNTRSIEIENGKCWISCDCNDHVALGASLGWNYHFNSIFDKHLNKLGTVSIENDQKKAVEIYQNQTLLQIIDVKTKINELENLVDTLDINSIINSYNSTYEYKYISRYRSDDDERLYIYRKASYSDLYLETLLPTQYFKSERGFADSNNYKLGSMSERELMIDDEIIKQNAREKYDKEEHKRMIINRFIKDSIENEKFVEKCLRINEAKSLLMKYENSVDGKHKIILLNSIIQG